MQFWALKLVSAMIKVFAFVLALGGATINIITLLRGDLEGFLGEMGIRFADGIASIITLHFCGLITLVIFCIFLYAQAHVIDALLAIERNTR